MSAAVKIATAAPAAAVAAARNGTTSVYPPVNREHLWVRIFLELHIEIVYQKSKLSDTRHILATLPGTLWDGSILIGLAHTIFIL